MAGPFGFAYGIGAGTAGIPDAIIKGREDAQQMALKNMQLEQMRKQMQDEEEARKIMASPFKGAPDTTVTTGGGEMPMAESAPGVAAEAYQQEAGGAPNTAIPQSMEIPKQTRTIKAYATPQQKMAAEYRQKAEMLRAKGLWRSAMELEKNAETFDDHHSKASRKGLADAIAFGPGAKDKALEYIHGMGGTGVVDVAPMNNGGLLLTIQDPNGQTHDVPLSKDQYTGLISGQDPATIINQAATQLYRDRALETRREEGAANRDLKRELNSLTLKERRDYHEGLLANQQERTAAMQRVAENRAKAEKTPAVMQIVAARTKNLVAIAAQNGDTLDPIVAEDMAWKWQKQSSRAKDMDLELAKDVLRRVDPKGEGIEEDNPNYADWVEAKKTVSAALKKKTAATQAVPAPTKAQTPANIPEGTLGTAKDGTPVVRRNGKWVAQ